MNAPQRVVSELADFLRAHHWMEVRTRRQSVALFRSPAGTEVLLPLDEQLGDYDDLLARSVRSVAKERGMDEAGLLEALAAPGIDRVRFRLSGSAVLNGKIPLSVAVDLLGSAQRCFLAAACSTLRPRPFFARLSLAEADAYVRELTVGHTERGSYVVPFEAPLRLAHEPLSFPDVDRSPGFGRAATRTLFQAIATLVETLEEAERSASDHVFESLAAEATPVSANLCEALAGIVQPDADTTLDLRATWSPRAPEPVSVPTSVRIEARHAERLARVASRLRPSRAARTDRFIGVITELRGTPDGLGGVEGEITVRLFHDDDTAPLLAARANLSASQYEVALEAHRKNQVVEIAGKLARRPRLSRLDDVSVLRPLA